MKTLLIDIETAPAQAYIWNLKTRYVPLSQVARDGHILCFAAGWLGDEDIYFCSRWEHGEKAMVKNAWEMLDEADAVIHYNGNNFDIPRLNAEFLVHRLGPPAPSQHVDLYRVVSRKFRVLSKSMNHMLRLLSLEEKLAHKGMELWTGVMQGVKEDQQIMEEYNIRDVMALENLYHELLPWIDNHPNLALWMGDNGTPRCRNCGSTKGQWRGYERTSVLSYRRWHCTDCGAWSRSRFAEETGINKRKDVLR